MTKRKNGLFDFSMLLLGATLIAIGFNLFLLPNKIVVGFTGLSVIAKELWNIRPSLFLAISYVFLTIISFIFLGKSYTKKMLLGAVIYPLLVEATSYLIPFIDLDQVEIIVMVGCGAILYGAGSGLVYKVGYSTGGSDVIINLTSKYTKRSMGTALLITNGIIIGLGFLIFGLRTAIYSLFSAYVASLITDRVMIGISHSKSFYIITKKDLEVKKYLTQSLSHGVTIIPAVGGYTGNAVTVIMCIIPTKEYIPIKENILGIDSEALILVSDTYEVLGGK